MAGVVAVTGATGGIGSAVVARLAASGYEVVAFGRSEEALAELPAAVRVPLDLAAGVIEAPAGFERLDGLVHCAGISEVGSVADTPREVWETLLAVNVTGPAELTRVLLPALRAAGGHVIFVNAAPGLHGVPNWSAYTASKAALTELADSLREEEAAHGVRVTSIYPGGVRTEMLRRVREQLGRPYDPAVTVLPETLASLVVTLLEFPADAQVLEVSLRAAPPRPG